jgi:dihydrofolate synthase/folylpolyglutamate synthase
MLATKDLGQFLAPLASIAADIRLVPVPNEPLSRDPEASVAIARGLDLPAEAAASVSDAVTAIAASGQPGDVLVCGSLYLVGHILRTHG